MWMLCFLKRSFFPAAIRTWAVCLILVVAQTGYAESRDEQARMQFDQGRDLFNRGRYEQAAVALERAYELRPSYKILYYIGWAEVENEEYARALDAFTKYLDQGGDQIPAQRAREVSSEMEDLRSLVGMVEIECGIDGATVMVDGERRGVTPLGAAVIVDLGKHDVVIKKGVEELHRELVRVAGGQRIIVHVQTDLPLEESGPTRVWTWVAFGLGGAAAVTAAITGSVALSQASDVKNECDGNLCPAEYKDDARRVERLSWATNGLVVVAAAGVVAGTLLYFFEPDSLDDSISGRLVPVIAPGSGGIMLKGKF